MLDYNKKIKKKPGADFTAVERIFGDPGVGLLLLCDHASNALPPEYGSLGLHASELQRHIAYDIGAAHVTRLIAENLGVPAVLSTFSRLLIDPNRGLDDPTLVMRLSDGAVVPGNARIDEAEKARRIKRFYMPYHAAISEAIENAIAAGTPPVILSVHSFTARWKTATRPWHATILYDKDLRFAKPLAQALRDEAGLVIGENVPYSGELDNDCMSQHGSQRGLAHGLIELRQDLIAGAEGQAAWANRLSAIVARILADPAADQVLHRITEDPRVIADFSSLCVLS